MPYFFCEYCTVKRCPCCPDPCKQQWRDKFCRLRQQWSTLFKEVNVVQRDHKCCCCCSCCGGGCIPPPCPSYCMPPVYQMEPDCSCCECESSQNYQQEQDIQCCYCENEPYEEVECCECPPPQKKHSCCNKKPKMKSCCGSCRGGTHDKAKESELEKQPSMKERSEMANASSGKQPSMSDSKKKSLLDKLRAKGDNGSATTKNETASNLSQPRPPSPEPSLKVKTETASNSSKTRPSVNQSSARPSLIEIKSPAQSIAQ